MGFLSMPEKDQCPGKLCMSRRKTRVEGDRSFDFVNCDIMIPLKIECDTERPMCEIVVIINLHGPHRHFVGEL